MATAKKVVKKRTVAVDAVGELILKLHSITVLFHLPIHKVRLFHGHRQAKWVSKVQRKIHHMQLKQQPMIALK